MSFISIRSLKRKRSFRRLLLFFTCLTLIYLVFLYRTWRISPDHQSMRSTHHKQLNHLDRYHPEWYKANVRRPARHEDEEFQLDVTIPRQAVMDALRQARNGKKPTPQQQPTTTLPSNPGKPRLLHHTAAQSSSMSSEDLVYAKEEDNYLLPHGDGRDPQEKYMSYIPHSGFHNQRIALTNALMLAYRLNRTLLVPPVVLGNPIHWRKYDSLESFHRKSTKTHLGHCQGFLDQFGHLNTNSGDEVPLECRSSFRYTSLRWDRLFNMTSVKERVRIRYRDTYARTWLQDKYGLSKDDTYAVKDELLYDYRIADKEDVPIGKYQRDILLSDLQQRPERLISFGSLFGHGRVMTSTKESKELQVFIMKQFVFSPSVLPELFTEANRIIAQLGGPQTYISVHARVGDSIFERYSDRVMAKLWSDLRKYLPLIKSSQTPGGVADAPANACFQSPNSTLAVDPRSRRLLQDRPLVLFMATDAPHPRQHPTLQRFFSTFPCVVTLNDMYDFPSSSLATMVNPSDGVNFGQFFVPFLDGIVAGHAQEFTGSMWSTFSSYIRFLHTQFVE